MQVVAQCPNCYCWFPVDRTCMQRQTVYINNERYILTTLTCPECQHENVVEMDSSRTLDLLKLQFKLDYRIGQTQHYNGNPTKKQAKQQKAISKELLQQRNMLKSTFSGSLYQLQGVMKKLEFYVPTIKIVGEENSND